MRPHALSLALVVLVVVIFLQTWRASIIPIAAVPVSLVACRLRLRPILMTSIAFIMGVWPLVHSFGAGAEMRHAMAVAVFSGMIGVTFFGLLLTPVFYVTLTKKRRVAVLAGPLEPAMASSAQA